MLNNWVTTGVYIYSTGSLYSQKNDKLKPKVLGIWCRLMPAFTKITSSVDVDDLRKEQRHLTLKGIRTKLLALMKAIKEIQFDIILERT